MTAIDNPVDDLRSVKHRGAVLDDAHVGHINGAMGTILHGDIAPRIGWRARLKTLLAMARASGASISQGRQTQ